MLYSAFNNNNKNKNQDKCKDVETELICDVQIAWKRLHKASEQNSLGTYS